MGISPISCKCVKSCRDCPNEVDLAKGDYLRSKSGNFRINNNPINTGNYHKIRTHSYLFNNKNFDFKISSEIGNINPKEKVKEAIPPTIFEDSQENNYIEKNNNPIKTVATLNMNNNIILENDFNPNNEQLINTDINKNDDFEKEKQIKSPRISIKYIPNFDKSFFFTENIKRGEKNFSQPLNYQKDWQKYIKEDDENDEMITLINTMNNNKGKNRTKEDGEVMEYNNQKYLYIGETDLNQLPTGLGVLYTNGKKYEGYFCKGKILGLGRFIDKEGNSYEGIFRGNKIISKATVIKRNDNDKKVVFFGDLVDLRKNGKGEEICENEYKYLGDFVDDKWNGEGQLENLETGDIYNGQFVKGEITGKGIFKWKNGEIYEGNFEKGIKHGKGIHKWPDGSEYKGEYENGIREGKAEYKWADGRVFKGKFKNGKPEGKGIIFYNGKNVKCEYKDGKPTSDISKLFQEQE